MKISVIVPVYNAEKYLSVCLKSLLIQTFTDFEVIVVDDCSTDNSVAVAESFLERFNGRLKIFQTQKNSGGGGYIPRNIGLDAAQGKYIFFADADDFVLDNALEILYNAAENSQADVVYTESGFMCGAVPVPEILTESFWNPPKFSHAEPTFETDNIGERVKKFLQLAFGMTPWQKFLRRDFLIDSGIRFLSGRVAQDVVWTFKVICSAKKILRLPTPLYVYRTNDESLTKKKRSPEKTLSLWTNPLIVGVGNLDEFMSGVEFFRQNPAYRFGVLKFFVSIQLDYMMDAFKTLTPEKSYEIFLREFSAADSSQAALIAYLLVMNNLYRNELI